MREVLRNTAFARLFAAQVGALLGTGLLTVALGLLALDVAGDAAGAVLGTALTIKMLAYVGLAPVIAAVTAAVPRRTVMVAADLVRLLVALALPMVDEVWHVYVLIAVLQTASAAFTPTFRSVIPDIVPDERQYTTALSMSRLAYDLEALVSPTAAAVALLVMPYHWLFGGTAVGFAISAALVIGTRLPGTRPRTDAPFRERLTEGIRVFGRDRPLRSLLAMNLATASGTAAIIVTTVVIVGVHFGLAQAFVAVTLAASGLGSMTAALTVPRLIDRVGERRVMLVGAFTVPAGLATAALITSASPSPAPWAMTLPVWFALGAGGSLVATPAARLLRRASTPDNRSSVYTAQFSLSHGAFLITYPAAGALVTVASPATTTAALAVLGLAAAVTAATLWRPAPTPARQRISVE